MDRFQTIFIEEAKDLIVDLEKALLELSHTPEEKGLVERVFRAMHTLKGNSSMFGFSTMSALTHELETIYDQVREGKRTVSQELLTITLAAVDHLKALLQDCLLSDENVKAAHENVMNHIFNLIHSTPTEKPTIAAIATPVQTYTRQLATYYILFHPDKNILTNGTNPLFLLEELYQMGPCKVKAYTQHIPNLATIEPAQSYIYWHIVLATEADENAIRDVFMFVEDTCVLDVQKLCNENLLANEQFSKSLEELYQQQEVTLSQLKDLAKQATIVIPKSIAARKKLKAEEKTCPPAKEQVAASVRVSSEKLDDLMNLVSELVTTQASLSLLAEQHDIPELSAVSENIEKITRRLRDNTFSICLIPLEQVMTRFERLVHDLSAELKKDIVLITEGAETELDKTIIENLTDPILHILRNSIDHGIEDAATRLEKGKPKQARILFKAFYSGTNVHLQISDDGAGINPVKIREKAISKGLISPEAILSEKETLDLIFLPGFSTAAQVTDVSGRGVGMDIVKRKIADIRGVVDVQSKVNIGTTLTIKLPLTMSIIDGLLVKVDDTFLVIPLSAVEKCYETSRSETSSTFNNWTVLDGEKTSFFNLREEFDMPENTESIEQIVLLKYDDKRIGITVDIVVGEYQAVLKPLGKLYRNQEIVSGATILGDGTIALVLDTYKMIMEFSSSVSNVSI
jgi:two-component system chemotaxis sensor kinase CheA